MLKYRFVVWTVLITAVSLLAQTTEIQYLSGTGNDNTVKWNFMVTGGQHSNKWTKIPVPSCWELQGFGNYNYGRQLPHADEQGKYRYAFMVPQSWHSKKIELVFEGSMTDTEVWINGMSAGPVHKGAFYRFSYDITRLVRAGEENMLEVTVSKKSSNESVNLAERVADFWIFGGIFRPVYLRGLPWEHVDRVAIDAQADGSFAVDVFLENIELAKQVECQIKTKEGQNVGGPFSTQINKNDTHVRLTTQIENPQLWTAETPNLYVAEIRLKAADEMHMTSQKFGFRTVEVRKGDGIYVNNVKVHLKGVNRHSFWPESGRTLSKAISIEDVNLIKDMNMNAVRMSHYPPDAHFLDVCDSLGLFVLDELTGWQAAYDTETGKRLVKELVTRDVNHPCILFWDNGNEGGFNYELVPEFSKWDPQKRNVLHPWETASGINTSHYQDFEMFRKMLDDGPDLLMPTEIWHGLYDGGHGAGLQDYWDMAYNKKYNAGGFSWVFADEGVVRTDKNNILDNAGNQAPDGIVGPHHEKEASFFAIKEIYSPVYIVEKTLDSSFDGAIPVENRYYYTNLDQCSFSAWLGNFPGPFDDAEGLASRMDVQIAPVSCAPGEKSQLLLELPNNFSEYDVLYVNAKAKTGRDIYTWSFPLQKSRKYVDPVVDVKNGKIQADTSGNNLIVKAGNMEYVFETRRGKLRSVKKDGNTISFNNGPRLAAGGDRPATVHYGDENGAYVIESDFHSGNFIHLKWTVYASGWLKLDYLYRLYGYHDFMGVSFDYPEEMVQGMKWLGMGPYRVWKNRTAGVMLNVWQNDYNDTTPGESWDYPEFKGYYDAFHWVVIDTKEGQITVMTDQDDLYLRMLTPNLGKDARTATAPFPGGDISFLHGISPIGTKFRDAVNTGPHGVPYEANGDYTGTLYFYFGEK